MDYEGSEAEVTVSKEGYASIKERGEDEIR